MAVGRNARSRKPAVKLKGSGQGQGLKGYMSIYKHYLGVAGQTLAERAKKLMSPQTPKTEGDIAEAVDKWLEGLRNIQGHKGYDMSVQLKVTALKMMMVGRAKDL